MGSSTVSQDMQPQTRVVGGNYTVFTYAGQTIAFLEQVDDSGQPPFGGASGAGFDVIQPLGHTHPVEIVTARVVTAGQITLAIRELWKQNVWEHLSGLAGTNDIIEIFDRLAATPQYVQCSRIITSPYGVRRGDV